MLNRGTFTLPRLNAHRVVLAAVALTTLVAAALATTLVVFSDQALPRTVRQQLTAAPGTSMIVAGLVTNTALRQKVSSSAAISGLELSTSLDAVLTGTATSLGVSRSLLAVAAVELFLLAGAALVAVAQLLAAQREGEYAMLAARGATRPQLIRMAAAEAFPVCLLAGAGGAAAGVWLAGRIAARGTGTLAGAWWAAAVVSAGAAVIMVAPAGLAPAPGAARIRRGRQAVISAVSRAGTDVAVVVLAVLAGWQLRRYSVATTTLFRKILPGGARPGVPLTGQTAEIRLAAALGPARLKLAAATVTITFDDADGDAYQLAAGTLPAAARAHTLTVRVAPAGRPVL